ncbi:hypothetical protein B0H16DRAFT_1301388 [Mycena metata]|uniref:T6SS Phospholipase effector Tle1-like catalytic domain-containing protein n=1 Tax=Mycena metata TaxID=1033252 RepID=A0AAD7K6A6_9AGAR|nr:hypothetical protein B0H16DRAFT_1301388 [Mycena metata]
MNFQSLPLPFPRFPVSGDFLAPVRQCECNCIAACRCACSCRDHCTCKASCEGTCAGHVSRNLIVSLDDVYKKSGVEVRTPLNSTQGRANDSQQSTNVLELHSRVLADTNPNQLTYYDCAGIQYSNQTGFQSWLRRVQNIVDRALGWNSKKPVLKAYRWLCEQYKPGDKIFLIGFARGGRQVLFLRDMIEKVGLVNAGNPDLVEYSYNLYLETQRGQGSYSGRAPSHFLRDSSDNSFRDAERFKTTFSRGVKIHFVGLWSVPVPAHVGSYEQYPRDAPPSDSKFCSLPSSAKHVCFFRHALALDEHRAVKSFPVYNPEYRSPPKHTDIPNIKEVWFAGDRTDM